MAEVPEIKVELIHNPKVGKYGGGSEAANALAAPAIAAALHDATGKTIRRLPMKPAYVKAVLITEHEQWIPFSFEKPSCTACS
jgi:CO/xanthine dehydrogenase Mo-binding subunit